MRKDFADKFRRLQIEVKVQCPIDTQELLEDSDLLITLLLEAITKSEVPYKSIGKWIVLGKSNLYEEFPDHNRDFRISFYADIKETS